MANCKCTCKCELDKSGLTPIQLGERRVIENMLTITKSPKHPNGNLSQTAIRIGCSRVTCHKKAVLYGLWPRKNLPVAGKKPKLDASNQVVVES